MEELNRPSPEELLSRLKDQRETEEGTLKIFFGYAAGVGKTYAMLEAARRAKSQGIDVAVGYIEPHTRPETMALLEGLETLPVRSVWYRGLKLDEFDLDGALARHPKIVALVEERRAVLASYGEALIATGAAVEALPALEAAAAEQPLDEAAHARLILGYRVTGRRAQAFAVYRTIRRRLAEELGVDPGPELSAAHADLLGCDTIGPDRSAVGADGPARTRHPVPAQLPAQSPTFTGRRAQLEQLTRLVTETEPPGGAMRVVALSGTAGVGKTALAVHFAHQIRHRYPDGQLYVNLRGFDPQGTAMGPVEAIRGFLHAFGVPAERIPAGLDAQAALYRSVLAARRVLVVLDNARDADHVRPLLPGSAGCLVLVTSRNQLASLVATDGAHPVALGLPTRPG